MPPSRNGAAAFLGPSATANYQPSAVGLGALSYDQRGLFTLHDVERMRRDPKIQLGLRILRAPLPGVQWTVNADQAEVGEFADAQFRRIWSRELTKLTRSLEYGSCGGEVLYEQAPDRGQITFDSLRDVHVFDLRPLQSRGKLAGVALNVPGQNQEGNRCRLLPPRSLWIANEPEYGGFYGQSRLKGAWPSWMEKTGRHGAVDIRRLWYVKNAYRGGKMRHPAGVVEIEPGIYKSNQDYAREIAEKVETGGIMVLPTARDEDGNYLWDYEEPSINGELRDVRDYPKDLDHEILEGMGIPPEVVDASETGSGWSGRSVPFLVYLTSEDQIAQTLLQAVNEQIVKPLVAVNFGPQARYQLQIESLVPKEVQEEANKQGQGAGGAAAVPGFSPGRSQEKTSMSLEPDRSDKENASPVADTLIEKGALAAVTIADEIRKKVRALAKKKYPPPS